MIELRPLTDFLLRQSGYRTDFARVGDSSVLYFENESVMGFAFIVDTAREIIEAWRTYESNVLRSKSSSLRRAGNKSWNVYCVLITAEKVGEDEARRVLRIEEDLERTRKIARTGVDTEEALRAALISLLPLQSHPKLKGSDYQDQLEARLQSVVGVEVAEAFFGESPAETVASMLQVAP